MNKFDSSILGMGFKTAQYARCCNNCFDGHAVYSEVMTFLDGTMAGGLLEGASEGVFEALHDYTQDTGLTLTPKQAEDEELILDVIDVLSSNAAVLAVVAEAL
jgi:hypothetical protein